MKALTTIILTLLATPAPAQQRETFRDANGRVLGWSNSNGRGGTTFYDSSARTTGRAVTNNSGTTFYDRMGRTTGRVTNKPQGK